MKRIFLTMGAAAVLALALLVSCGKDASDDNDGRIEISAILQLNPEIVLENNPVIAMIEQELNITLKIEAPPVSSFGDRVKILVSTNRMPDLVQYGADIFATQWAEEGLLLDVTDKIDNYPNLKANISTEQFSDCIFLPDRKIYGIPRPNSYDKWGYLINKKWLDALGLEPPRTVAEFTEVCRAFTFNDPDRNGRNDTYGVSFNAEQSSLDSGIWHLQNDFFSMAYRISGWHHGMPDFDGSAKLRALKSAYPNFMKQLRDMYAQGIIDREFITHNASENYEKIAQGRVGIVGVSQSNYITAVLERYNMNMDDFIYCPPLVLDESQTPMYALPPSNWMAYYINAAASPEKQDAILRLLDWANSERGFTVLNMGIEGLHYSSYDIDSRSVERSESQIEAFRKASSAMLAFAVAFNDLPSLQGGSSPALTAKWQREASAAEALTAKCYFGFTKMLDGIGVNFPDIIQNLNSLEVRCITGEASWEQLDSYIQNTYIPATATIAAEFSAFMKENPPRTVYPSFDLIKENVSDE